MWWWYGPNVSQEFVCAKVTSTSSFFTLTKKLRCYKVLLGGDGLYDTNQDQTRYSLLKLSLKKRLTPIILFWLRDKLMRDQVWSPLAVDYFALI